MCMPESNLSKALNFTDECKVATAVRSRKTGRLHPYLILSFDIYRISRACIREKK